MVPSPSSLRSPALQVWAGYAETSPPRHGSRSLVKCSTLLRCAVPTLALVGVVGFGALALGGSGQPCASLPPGVGRLRSFHSSRKQLRGRSSAHASGSNHQDISWLVQLLPTDFDDLQPPPRMGRSAFLNALGAQIMLFAGFAANGAGGWVRDPASGVLGLPDRVRRIQPTWKSDGAVDYSLAAQGGGASEPLPLFRIGAPDGAAPICSGDSVLSLAVALGSLGLEEQDLDNDARGALRRMLTWRLPEFPAGPVDAVFAFSFDATPACHNVSDCDLPGPSNELLAATVERFVEQSERPVEVYAQWEIAAALLKSAAVPPARVHAAGTPGGYESTVQVLEKMLRAADAHAPTRAAVLAHPDHLPRAFWTAQARLAAWSGASASTRLVPAMAPYVLAWPRAPAIASEFNLYSGVEGAVHTQGTAKPASWYDESLGFFPDGNPQKWVHEREVWLLYESWARAKGVSQGIVPFGDGSSARTTF